MKILESLELELKQSDHVWVDKTKIREFAENIDRNKILRHWLEISPFDLRELGEEKLGFLVVFDSISFSYWGNPKWQVEYKNKSYDGSQAMLACLGRAIEGGKSFDPAYLENIRREDLENILRGNVEIPLLDERLRILHEIGSTAKEKFCGDFRYIIGQSKNDALQLVDLLVQYFSSFDDSVLYKGKRIIFNKRAQLLVSDLNYSFGGFDNFDQLTACADYKLPQILRRHGILQYSNELQQKIKRREELPSGSQMEVEIRANTIHAVELIKGETEGLTSTQINDYLWLEGQLKLTTDEPYHLTRTTAY